MSHAKEPRWHTVVPAPDRRGVEPYRPGPPAVSGRTGRQAAASPRRPPRQLRNTLFPAPDVRPYLLPGEEVRYVDRRHPVVLLGRLGIVAVAAVLLGALVNAAGEPLLVTVYGYAVLAAVLWLLYRTVQWGRRLLVVTDRRVFVLDGILVRRVEVKPVFRQSVVFVTNPVAEALGTGRVMTTTATGDRVHSFRYLHDPHGFYEALTERAV